VYDYGNSNRRSSINCEKKDNAVRHWHKRLLSIPSKVCNFAAILFFLSNPPTVLWAQDEPALPEQSVPVRTRPKAPPAAEKQWGQARVLGEHLFPAASSVPFALSVSYVGARAGIEYRSIPHYAQLATLSTSQQQQFVDLQMVNVAENIDFALRLHDYVALVGDTYAKGQVGANVATLLGTGADYTYGGDLGALVKIVRIGHFQLAVRGQLGYYGGQKAGIQGLYRDLNSVATDAVTRLQRNPNIDLNTAITQLNNSFATATEALLTPFHGLTYAFSLNLALAIVQSVGLQGSMGFSSESATYQPREFDAAVNASVKLKSKVHTTRPSVAAALDFDAGPVGLPIDILLEYRATSVTVNVQGEDDPSSASSLESRLALGVYYSGRADLQLGITGYTLLGQAPAPGVNGVLSDKPQDFGAQLVFRYFW
jgi:hypothetical protein